LAQASAGELVSDLEVEHLGWDAPDSVRARGLVCPDWADSRDSAYLG
jgi:hypothetical protein